MDDKLLDLYNNLTSDGYELGSEQEFRNNIADPKKRARFYSNITDDGYELGTEEEFNSYMDASNVKENKPAENKPAEDKSGVTQESVDSGAMAGGVGEYAVGKMPPSQSQMKSFEQTMRDARRTAAVAGAVGERIGQTGGSGLGLNVGPTPEDYAKDPENNTYTQQVGTKVQDEYIMQNAMYEAALRRNAKAIENRMREISSEYADLQRQNGVLGTGLYDPWQNDEELQRLYAEQRDLENAYKTKNASVNLEKGEGGLFGNGFFDFMTNGANMWQSIGDVLSDVGFYDRGMTELNGKLIAGRIQDKIDRGEVLSDEEKEFMGVVEIAKIITGRYQNDLPNAYKWAGIGLNSAKFGLEIFMNPTNGLGKVLSNRLITKYGTTGIKSLLYRGLTRAGGDLVSSTVLANTLQAPKTFANVVDAVNNGKSLSEAVFKEEAKAIIENFTESMGDMGLGKVLKKGIKSGAIKIGSAIGGKIGSRIVNTVETLSKFSHNDWNTALNEYAESFGIHDLFGEAAEEEYGIILNSALNTGDAEWPDLVDPEKQLDIVGGLALSMAFMRAVTYAAGNGYTTLCKKELSSKDADCSRLFGEDWKSMKDAIDKSRDENFGNVVADLMNSASNAEERTAIRDYSMSLQTLRGVSLAEASKRNEQSEKNKEADREEAKNSGYDISTVGERADTKRVLDYLGEKAYGILNISEEEATDLDSYIADFGGVDVLADEMVKQGWSQEEANAILQYDNVKAKYEGIIQRVKDDIDIAIDQNNKGIDRITNANTGKVEQIVIRNMAGEQTMAYLLAGDPKADGTVVIADEAGNKMTIPSKLVLANTASTDPAVMKTREAEELRTNMAQKAANEIDGKLNFTPGEEATIMLNGVPTHITIDGPSASGIAYHDDANNIYITPPEGIQAMVDEAGRAAVAESDAAQGGTSTAGAAADGGATSSAVEVLGGTEVGREAMQQVDDWMSAGEDAETIDSLIGSSIDPSVQEMARQYYQEKVAETQNGGTGAPTAGTAAAPAGGVAVDGTTGRAAQDGGTSAPAAAAPAEGGATSGAGEESGSGLRGENNLLDRDLMEQNGDVNAVSEALRGDYPDQAADFARSYQEIAQGEADKEKDPIKKHAASKKAEFWGKVAETIQPTATEPAVDENAPEPISDEVRQQYPETAAKFEASKKVYGNRDVMVLPNGRTVTGRWMAIDVNGLTPSHDANFNPNPEYLKTAEGKSGNSRGYDEQKTRESVESIAADPDARLHGIVSTGVGFILNGNGRTMAAQKAAAKRGNLGKYDTFKLAKAPSVGIDAKDVEQIPNAVIAFVVDPGQLDMTPETLDLFNKDERKGESASEEAIRFGKTLPENVLTKLVGLLTSRNKLEDIYKSKDDCRQISEILQGAGVFNSTQVSNYFADNGLINAAGKMKFENVLMGMLFKSDEEAVRQLVGMPGVRKEITGAIGEVIRNRTLGEYSLAKELAGAIDLCKRADEARTNIDGIIRQMDAFDGNTLEGKTVRALAEHIKGEGTEMSLKELFHGYNNLAETQTSFSGDMFDGKKSKEDILTDVLNRVGTQNGGTSAPTAGAATPAEGNNGGTTSRAEEEGGNGGTNDYGYDYNSSGAILNPIKVMLPSVRKGYANFNDIAIAQANDGSWTAGAHGFAGDSGFGHGVSNNIDDGFATAYDAVSDLVRRFKEFAETKSGGNDSNTKDMNRLISHLENTVLPYLEKGGDPKKIGELEFVHVRKEVDGGTTSRAEEPKSEQAKQTLTEEEIRSLNLDPVMTENAVDYINGAKGVTKELAYKNVVLAMQKKQGEKAEQPKAEEPTGAQENLFEFAERKINERKEKKAEPAKDVDAELAGALDEFKSALADFKNLGKDNTLPVSLVGLNNAQIEALGNLFVKGAKLGYALTKKGVYDFEKWVQKMTELVGQYIKDATNWSDTDVRDFLTEVYNDTKIRTDEGKVQTIKQYVEGENKENNTPKEAESENNSVPLNTETINNNEDGSERTDEPRTEGLSADGVRAEGRDGAESKNAGQENERPDGRGKEGSRGNVRNGVHAAGRLDGQLKNTHNFHNEKGKDPAPKTDGARVTANLEAIKLMMELRESGEMPTAEQQQTLAKYSGWGGLGGRLLKSRKEEIVSLLGEEAYESIALSASTAYYTPVDIVDTLWSIAEKLGFKGGRVLEGSAGIGNILMQMPQGISEKSDIQAVEIDPTTGGILRLLMPDADVKVQGFEKTVVPNNSVDLAITNVPFVTGLHVIDEAGDKDLSRKFKNIHDYCIAKNIRKLREGGIGIFITSNGTLDNSKALRDWIVSDGNTDVIGAFRLPNNTFTGTPVTSDIIVVRKRVNGQKSAQAIDVSSAAGVRNAEMSTGKFDKKTGAPITKSLPMTYNQYFVEHPENMFGEMKFGFEEGDTFRPESKGLYPEEDEWLDERLAKWVDTFTAEYTPAKEVTPEEEAARLNEALGENVKEGSLFVGKDGNIYIANLGRAVVPMKKDSKTKKMVPAIDSKEVKGHSKQECIKAYTAIKDALREVLDYQEIHDEDRGLQERLDKLNKAFDSFVSTYGHLEKSRTLSFLRNDVDFANVLALEERKETEPEPGKKKVTYKKSEVFFHRVVSKVQEPKPTNVRDGIIASIFRNGKLDMQYIADALGKDLESVKAEALDSGLAFENPSTGEYEVSFEYLSGNVRAKLEDAREKNTDGRYKKNITALEKVVPATIPAHLIEYNLGSTWMDKQMFVDYIKDRTDEDVKLIQANGTWEVEDKKQYFDRQREKNTAFGVRSEAFGITIPGTALIECAMRNATYSVSRVVKDADGNARTETDKEATQACSNKINEIRQDFKDWMRERMQNDAKLAEAITKKYNDKFNNYAPKKIPQEFIPEHFPGAVTTMGGRPFKLYPHQGAAVVRATTQNLLFAHEVGTGKTFTQITTAMEMRRLGTAHKPMIVVQNATVGQFVSSAKALYPTAKILTVSEADMNAGGRKNFYAKIKYNDWDMIVIPQSVLERIPDSAERKIAYIQERIAEREAMLESTKDGVIKQGIKRDLDSYNSQLADAIAEFKEAAEKVKSKGNDRKAAMTREKARVKAVEMLDREVDEVEDFDSMGVDALIIDEAHEYKHLGFATAMQRGVKGVDPSPSKKSQGVYLKCQAVMEKSQGKNVIFATGTPISNTAAEIWTFMRYLMPADVMEEYSMSYFDDFTRNFGNISQMLEFATNGKFKEVNRFAGYTNLPELVRIWSGVADTVLSKDQKGVQEKLPETVEGGSKPTMVFLPQTQGLRVVMKQVRARLEWFESLSGKEKRANSAVPVVMFGVAARAAIDPRLVWEGAKDEPNSKTNKAVEYALESLKETEDYKGTVAIFADAYRRKGYETDADGNKIQATDRKGNPKFDEEGNPIYKYGDAFNLYEEIKRKLIEQGVSEEQIFIMKSGMSVAKKEEIFAKVNAGEIRVIMGSTSTLGTGVNIQERLAMEINMDAPNRPMDYTQRVGRIIRQGNMHKVWGKPVRIVNFGVEDSLDVTAYQRLKTKGNIADSIMNGAELMDNNQEARTIEEEEDTFGDVTATLSGSQYAMLKQKAERDVRKFEGKKKQWESDQIYVHNAIPHLKSEISHVQGLLDGQRAKLVDIVSKFPDGKAQKISASGSVFTSLDEMEELFKKLNSKQKERLDKLKADLKESGKASTEVAKTKLTVDIDGIEFVFHTEMWAEARLYGDQSISGHREVHYSCEALGLEDVPCEQGYIKNGMKDIIDNVITGSDVKERIDRYDSRINRDKQDLKNLEARNGRPFEHEQELADAKEKLTEYTEKMKEEMAEKEAKYKELDAELSDEGFSLSDVETEEEEEDLGEEDGEGAFRSVAGDVSSTNKADIRDSVQTLADELNVPVMTASTVSEFPEDVQKKIQQEKEKTRKKYGRANLTPGLYYNGMVYILLSDCKDVTDGVRTVLHEIVGHKGLRDLVGKERYKDFILGLYEMMSDADKNAIKDRADAKGWSIDKTMDEWLAEQAEDSKNYTLWDRITRFFNKWFGKFFGIEPKLSDADVRYLLWRSRQKLTKDDAYDMAKDQMFRSAIAKNKAKDSEDTKNTLSLQNKKANEYGERVSEREQQTRDGINKTIFDASSFKGRDDGRRKASNRQPEAARRVASSQEVFDEIERSAKRNGVWYEDFTDVTSGNEIIPRGSGGESLVYPSKNEGYVVKTNRMQSIGSLHSYEDLRDFVDRINSHNEAFPYVAYRVLGFSRDVDGHTCILLEQPYFEGYRYSSMKEAEEFLTRAGYVVDGFRNYHNKKYEISDVSPFNILTRDGVFIPIDLGIQHIDVSKRSIEFSESPLDKQDETFFRLREKESPKKTGIGYKVFYLNNGKLYPPMVANPNAEDTPTGVWLDADAAPVSGQSKTGRNQVKSGGKGTQGASGGPLSYRPGWHLGEIPFAFQFNRGEKVPNSLGIKNQKGEIIKVGKYFPKDFVWAEVEYANDVDYQEEAMSYGYNEAGNFQHSLAGLPKLPEDGSYKYRTNANPATDPWIITGAMKVNRILTPSEVDDMVKNAGREPQLRQEGYVTDREIEELNEILGLENKGGDDVSFRSVPVGSPIAGSQADQWDRTVESVSAGLAEVTFDHLYSLKQFEEFLQKVTGKPILATQMAHEALAQVGNKNFMDTKWFDQHVARVLGKSILDLVGKDNVARKNIRKMRLNEVDMENNRELKALNDYVQLKHGVERNRDMSVRTFLVENAKSEYKESMAAAVAPLNDDIERIGGDVEATKQELDDLQQELNSLKASGASESDINDKKAEIAEAKERYKQYSSELKEAKEQRRHLLRYPNLHGLKTLDDTIREKLDNWYADAAAIKELGMGWRETQQALDAKANEYGVTVEDYSGLTSKLKVEAGFQDMAYDAVEEYEDSKDAKAVNRLWKAIRLVNEFSMLKQQDTGLVSGDFIENQSRRFDYFVPLRGFAETTAEDVYNYLDEMVGEIGNPVKHMKGRTSEAGNSFGAMMNVAYGSINSGNRNAATTAFYNLVASHPSDIARISQLWQENTAEEGEAENWEDVGPNISEDDSPEEMIAKIDAFEKDMKAKEKEGLSRRKRNKSAKVPYRMQDMHHLNKHQVRVQINGQTRVITIGANPRVAEAVNGLLNPGSTNNKIVGALKTLKNFKAGVLTSMNIKFASGNIDRDTEYALANAWGRYGNDFFKKFQKHQVAYLFGVGARMKWAQMGYLLRKYRQEDFKPTNELEQDFKDFMDNGGATGYTFLVDMEQSRARLEDMVSELNRSVGNPKRWIKAFSDFIELVTQSSELTNRFSAYQAAKDLGWPMVKRISAANNITVNFSLKGAGVKGMRKRGQKGSALVNTAASVTELGTLFTMFYNANLQGKYNLWHLAKANPGKAATAVVALPMTIAAVMPYLNDMLLPFVYSLLGFGDYPPEDEEYYDLTDYNRQNNIVIRAPWGGWLKFAVSQELAPFYAVGDIVGGAMTGQREVQAQDFMQPFVDLVAPTRLNMENMKSPKTGVREVMGQTPLSDLVDIAVNRDFLGRTIYKDNKYPGDEFKPASTKGNKRTPLVLRDLASELNRISGGTMINAGKVDFNPSVMDHLANGMLGGYYKLPIDFVNSVYEAYGNRDKGAMHLAGETWENMALFSRNYISGSQDAKDTRVGNAYYADVVKFCQEMQYNERQLRKVEEEIEAREVSKSDLEGYAKQQVDLEKASKAYEDFLLSPEYEFYMDIKDQVQDLYERYKLQDETGVKDDMLAIDQKKLMERKKKFEEGQKKP